MKKFIAVIAFVLALIYNSAAQEYSILKVEGDVMVQPHKSADWAPAQRHSPISRLDKVKLSGGSSLSIVDVATNRIATSSKAGEYIVSDFYKVATQKSESLFRTLNKKLVRDIRKESERNNHYSTYGATTRGEGDEPDYSDSLYAAIYHAVMCDEPVSASNIVLEKVPLSSETFCFGVINNSDETFFINVLKVSDSGCSFCFSFPYDNLGVLLVTPHSAVNLSGYVFWNDPEATRYVLVATRRPYRAASLGYCLKKMGKPEFDTPAESVIFVEP